MSPLFRVLLLMFSLIWIVGLATSVVLLGLGFAGVIGWIDSGVHALWALASEP